MYWLSIADHRKCIRCESMHSDISVTLSVYTHVQFDDAQAEMIRLAQA